MITKAVLNYYNSYAFQQCNPSLLVLMTVHKRFFIQTCLFLSVQITEKKINHQKTKKVVHKPSENEKNFRGFEPRPTHVV